MFVFCYAILINMCHFLSVLLYYNTKWSEKSQYYNLHYCNLFNLQLRSVWIYKMCVCVCVCVRAWGGLWGVVGGLTPMHASLQLFPVSMSGIFPGHPNIETYGPSPDQFWMLFFYWPRAIISVLLAVHCETRG